MPLITKPPKMPAKEQLRIRLAKEVLEEIEAYCQWQDLERDYFFEQAALEIFKRDREWRSHKEKKAKA